MARDGPTVVVNYLPTLIVGCAALVFGAIFVLVGAYRTAAGIDYLVSSAADPAYRTQRRTRDDLFSQD
ncbi:hypothetical protein [Arthrobacter sp. efr-133-TYG-104]|uniref:hypothetical protein n=1 Tax=Arthrobacter sp. efr-133-TYG-104 TaxID=3040324 RepID=UPI00254D4A67|nr:hypothetical protein [Arthrobacter sp. efr-133-TYG-104]